MKRMIVYANIFTFFGFLCAMETNESHIIRYNTVPPIFLIKDDLYNRKQSGYTAITAAGYTHQSVIIGPGLSNIQSIEGDVFKCKYNELLLLDPVFKKYFNYRYRDSDDPISIIIEGKKLDLTDSSAWNNMEMEVIPGKLVLTVEPLVHGLYNDKKSYCYRPYRCLKSDNKMLTVSYDYYGDEALAEAEKGLDLCYVNLLKYAHTLFTEKDENRSIALPLLSKLLGMPYDRAIKIAAASVINFIKNEDNKDKYSEIQCVVEEENDFNYYKKMLDELTSTVISK